MVRFWVSGLAVLFTTLTVAAGSKPIAFTIRDGAKTWSTTTEPAKVLVVAFLSADCPMSTGYLPTLGAIHTRFAEQGVAVVGLYPNADDTAEKLAAQVKEFQLPFSVYRDVAHAAVNAVSAKTTPEVFVLDAERSVKYRGRIDDGYAARMKRKAGVGREDLADAITAVLAGKPVGTPETEAFGCPIEKLAKPSAVGTVTYHKDVLPILQSHCQSCHRAGQVGPFSLTSYKSAARWAETSLEEITAKRMPPWKPAPNDLLTGARHLPPEAVATFTEWVKQGTPEGDAKDAPPSVNFADGWTLGTPDLILEVPTDMTVAATGKDLFRVMVLPTNLTEDKFIRAVEVKPGNARVVHHTLQLIDTTGKARKLEAEFQKKQKTNAEDHGPGYTVSMGWGFAPDRSMMLGGWAPGALPKALPAGVGQRMPKGADIVVQFHFHRTGKVETDRTKIGLYFAKENVTKTVRQIPAAGLFARIPAGEKNYTVDTSWTLTEDATVYRVAPHMHMLGQQISLTATAPGMKPQTLIDIPQWDYNWQEHYELATPLKLPKGTVLRVRAKFDNSADNPFNPSTPPQAVRFGEQTTNEMCFVFMTASTGDHRGRLLSPVWK